MTGVPETWLTLVLGAISMLAALGAMLAALVDARRTAAAKKRVLSIVRTNQRVRRELQKAFSDKKIDDTEMRVIFRVLSQAIDEEERRRHSEANTAAKMFVRELHPYKSRRLLEDFAKDVSEREAVA